MKITIALFLGVVSAQDFKFGDADAVVGNENFNMMNKFDEFMSNATNGTFSLSNITDGEMNGTIAVPFLNMSIPMNGSDEASSWGNWSGWNDSYNGNWSQYFNATDMWNSTNSTNPLEDLFSNFTMPPTDLDQLGEWAENQTWPWEDGWEWPDKQDENPLCAKPRFMHGIFEQEGCRCNLTRWKDLQWQVPKNCKVFKGYNDCDSYEVNREKKLLSCEEHSYCQYAGRPKCVQYHEGKWLWETGATKLAASAAVAVAVASLL